MLADKLVSLHMNNSPYKKLPSYNYDQLRKGIICQKCGSFDVYVRSSDCDCEICGHSERVTDAVLRALAEFRILFPEKKVTTSGIHEWCGIVESKQRIRKILEKNFKPVGKHRWTYYE